MQDGRSSSLTAPHGPSQQAVIATALSEANVVVSELAGLEMHGTGTPLGDPIEIGAALAVLQSDKRPIQLSAAKSILGHAEPAAGSVGIAHAVSIMIGAHSSLLPHVRAPNPHILGILEASGKGSCMKMPRQPGARVCVQSAQAMGVSAFAFQGTNAHAVLQPVTPGQSGEGVAVTWVRHRFWYKVRATASLYQAICREAQATFHTKLSRPVLAFLLDHQIQGAALFPGSGMFDMAASACQCLAGGHEAGRFALLAASIAAPLPMRAAEEKLLICNIHSVKGLVDIQSQAGQAGRQSHLRAHFGERRH